MTAPSSVQIGRKVAYRPEIDGLRAIAVMAVILNHMNKGFIPSGYLGVDIFFVISGYVITKSLLARTEANFKTFLLEFYARRIRRLLPAMAVFVVVTAILTCLFNPVPAASLSTGLAALFGASNLWLIKTSTDYFAASTELNTFTHTWSLGVEEQFYLLFPVIVWFTGATRGRLLGVRTLTIIMSTLMLISLISFIVLSRASPVVSYFSMPTRFWQMGAGCMLCLAGMNEGVKARIFDRIPPILPLIATIATLFIGFKVKSTLAVVVFVFLLLASLRPKTLVYQLLTLPPIRAIGLMSYSIYLWHWTVLAISRWTVGIHAWTIPWQLALIMGLGAISYQCVENPIRLSVWARTRTNSFRLGGIILAMGSLFMGVLLSFVGHRMFLGDIKREQLEANVPFENSSVRLEPNCMWWMGNGPDPKKALQECSTAAPGPIRQHLYLLGDSHTGNYQAWADAVSNLPGVSLTRAYAGGQSVPVISRPREPGDIRYKDGEMQSEFLDLVLKNLKSGDVVIISSYILQQFRTDQLRMSRSIRPGLSRWQAWQEDLETLIQKVEAKGSSLVFVLPPPDFKLLNGWQNITNENCTLQWFRDRLDRSCLFSRPRMEIINEIKPIETVVTDLSQRHRRFYVYNPFPLLCPPEFTTCTNYLNGRRTYIDYSHLTRAGSGLLVDDFEAFLARNKLIRLSF